MNQKLSDLLDLNMKFIDGYKELMILLMDFSKDSNIPLPQNIFYLISESNRLTLNIKNSNYPNHINSRHDCKNFAESNLLLLETIKELMNTLISYSEKNDIQIPLKLYYLLYDGNKFLVSDEFLQGIESDADLTEP